jgi:hypothetical protein
MMKTIIEGGSFQQVRYIFIFIIILLQACASVSGERITGSEFIENLPGLWEGSWKATNQGNQHINIIKVEGSEVQLTGFAQGGTTTPDTEEVYGRIENSMLVLTWPAASEYGCKDKLIMTRDASNKLRLDGNSECGPYHFIVSLFKKE